MSGGSKADPQTAADLACVQSSKGLVEDSQRNYRGVQALRAVAASLVVLQHAISRWAGMSVRSPLGNVWGNGSAGVDIFFVISGFVMVMSLPGLAGKKNKAGVFLWRRLTRIVPLYWGATTVKFALLKLLPSAAQHPVGTPWHLVASYLFIPARNGIGEVFPMMYEGWTLNYEMLFYVLFTLALALDVYPVVALAPCLTVLAVAGMLRPESWPAFTTLASPLVIEFLFGMILAHVAMRRKLPGAAVAMLLLGAGFAALMTSPMGSAGLRIVTWGLPAGAMVAGAVALERKMGGYLPKWLLEAGDASYALYLSHALVMPVMTQQVLRRLPFHGVGALAVAIVLGFGVSYPVALLIHRHLEKPLMKLLKSRREKPRQAIPASAAVIVEETGR